MLQELSRVLRIAKLAPKVLSQRLDTDELIGDYAALASLVEPLYLPRIAPDPDDDVVIGTALAARATLIVTGDKPLLSVGAYRGVRIVGVAEALSLCSA